MAFFHANINIITRSEKHSALAAAAYRAAEDIGPHKYAKRGGVRDTEIMYPADAPDWVKAMGRAELWQSVEDVEKRRDAQLARAGDFALPRELSWPQRRELVRGFVAEYYCGRGMVVDVAYHDGRNGENPHWHPMAPMRRAEAEGWGKKAREWNDKAWLQAVRQGWAEHVNAALERAGVDARIDHRTLAEQGIDRTPQQHRGRYWSSLEQLERALETEIADEERRLESLENQIRQMQEDKDNEQKDHQDNERAAEIRDDAGAAGRNSEQNGGRDADSSAQDEQRSRVPGAPGEKGLLTPRIIAAPPRPIEEQRAMEAWEAAQAAQRNQDKPSRPPETAEERKRRLCSRAPRETENVPQEPAQDAQAPAQEIEADAQEIARIIAEAEAWDRRMAQEPPPADINEHCDRARQGAALHYRADKARQGVILPLESGEVQRAAQRAEEQAWETYVPHQSDQAAQDNNQDDNNPLATWKRDLEAAGAPPPRKGRDRDDFSR